MNKVLLIEDDKTMRENTAELLELADFDVCTADNGMEGVQKALEFNPDIILCDIMMPKLDGYGVLNMLSKKPQTSSIPFIFLTAKAEKSEVRKGMSLGADDYLTKPFEETELLSAIDTRLKKITKIKEAFESKSLDHTLFAKENVLDEILGECNIVEFKPKQVIYNEGDEPQYLYFVVEGEVKSVKHHEDGKELLQDMYSNDSFFGLTPIIENLRYSDSAIALKKSKVRKIPKDKFIELIYSNRDIGNQFIQLMAKTIENKERLLLSMAYDTVRKRTANSLIRLHELLVEGDEIKVTRDDLANMAGTAVETVIRCLSEYKNDGLIEVSGRTIRIINLQALKSINY